MSTMANAKTATRISEVSFRFDVTRVSELNDAESPDFIIYGVPWKVKIKKDNRNGEDSLVVYLHCAEKSLNWTYIASALFKLLPFNGTHDTVEEHIGPLIFDSIEPASGVVLFRWCSLFDNTKNYVKNDMISLKVDILVNMVDPNEENGSKLVFENIHACVEGCSAKYRLTVSNTEHLKALRSPIFMWRNTSWYLSVYKDHIGQLGISLAQKILTNDSSCEIKMLVRAISTKAGVKAIERAGTMAFGAKMIRLMRMERLVLLDELTKPENGFVQNNSITIEVKLNVVCSEDNGTKRKMTTTSNEAKLFKLECAVCLSALGDQVSFTPCGHMFCTKCIEDSVKLHKRCPFCNGPVKLAELKPIHLPRAE